MFFLKRNCIITMKNKRLNLNLNLLTVNSRQSARFLSASTSGIGRPFMTGIVATICKLDDVWQNISWIALLNCLLRSSILPEIKVSCVRQTLLDIFQSDGCPEIECKHVGIWFPNIHFLVMKNF